MKLSASFLDLSQNPYGNYAIQISLDTFNIAYCSPLIEGVRGKMTQLSILKYSSNVVEKCLEKASKDIRSEFIRETLQAENILSNDTLI